MPKLLNFSLGTSIITENINKNNYIPAVTGCLEISAEGNFISSKNWRTIYSEIGTIINHMNFREQNPIVQLPHPYPALECPDPAGLEAHLFSLAFHLPHLIPPPSPPPHFPQTSRNAPGSGFELPALLEWWEEGNSLQCRKQSSCFSIPFHYSTHTDRNTNSWTKSSGNKILGSQRIWKGMDESVQTPAWHTKIKWLINGSTARKWDKLCCPGGSGKVDTTAVLDFLQGQHQWLQKNTTALQNVSVRLFSSTLKDKRL